MVNSKKNEQSEAINLDQSQHNFVENQDPVLTMTCIIVAAAYLGLARYCFEQLSAIKNWQLLFNVESFFLLFALLAIAIAVRPFLSPSSLQISRHGIKYQGPYWPRRKTVNWDQVLKLYLSNEFIVILYRPDPKRKRSWPLWIPTFYLGEREKIVQVVTEYSPTEPIMMTNLSLSTWVILGVFALLILIWLLEAMVG
jgi:hypothetical protein